LITVLVFVTLIVSVFVHTCSVWSIGVAYFGFRNMHSIVIK